MELGLRPLGQGGDALDRLFVGRQRELAEAKRALAVGLNVLVLGRRGSGRTTFMNMLHRQLGHDGTAATVWLTADDELGPHETLDLISRTALRELTELDGTLADSEPGRAWLGHVGAVTGTLLDGGLTSPASRPSLTRSLDVTKATLARLAATAGRQVVVFIDDLTPSTAASLFGRHRDEFWQLDDVVWVLSGLISDSARYREPPLDSFLNPVVEIGGLTAQEIDDVIGRRTGGEVDPAFVHRLFDELEAVSRSDHTPREVIQLVSSAHVADLDGDEVLDRASTLRERLQQLPARSWDVYTDLLEYGPATASDPALAERVGLGRGSLDRYLRMLAQQELVVPSDRGRSVVYQPIWLFDREAERW